MLDYSIRLNDIIAMGIKLFITYTNLNLSECKEKQRQQRTCHAMTQYPSKISSRDKAAHQPALWRVRRGNMSQKLHLPMHAI